MTTATLSPPAPPLYDRDDPADRVLAALVCDAHDAELLGRIDASLHEQLVAVFEATGGLPSSSYN
jgi:hypothetical protein